MDWGTRITEYMKQHPEAYDPITSFLFGDIYSPGANNPSTGESAPATGNSGLIGGYIKYIIWGFLILVVLALLNLIRR